MDADDLRIVDAVAKNGSMSQAASKLHMAQSSVTSRIRLLEEELGVQLFRRHSRGVEPSEAGLRLLSYVEGIHELFQKAITAVKEDGTPKGRLRIGAMETTASTRLPEIIAAYTQKYPTVELFITTGPATALINQVMEHQLDGAFVMGPAHRQEFYVELIFLEELVLIGPRSLRNLNDLAKVENLKAIVFREGCSCRQRLGSILDGLKIPYVVMECASLDAIITCIAGGVGVTLLPKTVVEKYWSNHPVTVHELPVEQAEAEIVFIRRQDQHPTNALKAFLRLTHQDSNIVSSADR
jgi:DNA-binding transcriptional LysR family regulator